MNVFKFVETFFNLYYEKHNFYGGGGVTSFLKPIGKQLCILALSVFLLQACKKETAVSENLKPKRDYFKLLTPEHHNKMRPL